MLSPKTALFSLAIAVLGFFALPAPLAQAQVHWDASLQAGGAGRIFSNAVSGGIPGTIGPVIGVEGDVALIPLLRLGAYADFEYTDTTEPSFSSVVSFGGRVKLMFPGYRKNVHVWLFTGLGGVVWNAPAYNFIDNTPGAATPLQTAPTATGYFLEVPVGVGLGWRIRRPWELVAELQGRFGFDMGGSYFTQDEGTGTGTTRPTTAGGGIGNIPTGNDVVGILLTVGIGFDQ